MKKSVGLLLLAALLTWACAETNSSVAGRAATCAMCGASVGPDYFAYTADRSMGPTNR
ncbi:MAG: hypothetical protein NTY36_08395 [Deltaproteobacteria bacterium]|nr:hypothetical protein [Deltaproteobacteria bacterium]